MKRYLLSLFVFVLFLFSASAQNRFVTLDWQELPPVQTLPSVVEHFPLPDDYRSYIYKVDIEFPEFEDVDEESAKVLATSKVTLPTYPQVESTVQVSAHKGILNVSFIPVVYRNGRYQRINSFKYSIVPTRVIESRGGSSTIPTAANSVLASGKFVKIRVSASGVYRITYSELKRMGFSDPSKVRLYGYGGYLLSRIFDEHPADDLPEVPMYRGGDAVLFYARGPISWKPAGTYFTRERNFYSDFGYYFLTENGGTPAEFPTEEAVAISENKIETFNAFALHEEDSYTWGKTGRELYDGYDYVVGNTQNYSFELPGITNDPGHITVVFAARSVGLSASDATTSLSASINGVKVGTQTISGISSSNSYYTKATETTFNDSWAGNKTEKVTVTLTHSRPAGVSGRLNYIVLNYQQALRMNNSWLSFRSLASVGKETTFVISGANSSTVVWDVTSPSNYKRMNGVLSGDTYSFSIPASNTLREFVAVNTSGAFNGVETVGEVPNQNLHALTGVDMVIIVPDKAGLLREAERLAQAHRDHDGMTVQIVTAPQVYNEFSSGTPDATAYRRLMKMLYDRSSSDADRPKYLLLFGDCSYDNRMITSTWSKYKPADFLLCYQSENSVQETTSYVTDDYFGFLDNKEGNSLASGSLDIGIGRFPVRTAEEAKIAVDKTIAYMDNKEVGPWKRTLCYVADDGDSNTHMSQADKLAAMVQKDYPEFQIERIYADAFRLESSATGASYPQATSRLLKMFDQGMLVVNYTGHGSTTAWSAENILTADHITKLSSARLPLWITATCDFTRFDDIATSAGELAFLNANGGAIALFSTSRVVYSYQNSTLNTAFTKYLFSRQNGKRLTLGDIMRLAKCDPTLSGDSNKLNFTLIGDPALALTYPDYQIEVDEFSGPLTDEMPYVKAGGKVTVKGHILTPDGTPADDFMGTVHPLVFDSEETVTTLDNAGEGAFTYKERSKILFSGTDSVRNGRFEFTFPVPLDINYSNASGMLSLYACNEEKQEAGGAFDRFLVGGTADDLDPSDTDGPEIMLYLNTPDFPWGGQVNETPYFVAEIKDEDGINTVGNGVGHDLSLCIDGRTTYSLNDYYTPVAGSYTEGKVAFSIPALSEGKHSLTFRAWDIKNNSSVKQLDFEVVKGLRPDLLSINCTKSPAREETTFVLSHDRPGSELSVRIAVCDFSGRELWVHNEQGISNGGYYYVDWDLCSNAGQRLSPGVYLFRASIISENSKESTKTEKIVILAQ